MDNKEARHGAQISFVTLLQMEDWNDDMKDSSLYKFTPSTQHHVMRSSDNGHGEGGLLRLHIGVISHLLHVLHLEGYRGDRVKYYTNLMTLFKWPPKYVSSSFVLQYIQMFVMPLFQSFISSRKLLVLKTGGTSTFYLITRFHG